MVPIEHIIVPFLAGCLTMRAIPRCRSALIVALCPPVVILYGITADGANALLICQSIELNAGEVICRQNGIAVLVAFSGLLNGLLYAAYPFDLDDLFQSLDDANL